jgi:predicted DNA-binding protein YlxM (UPF0122 family)
MNQGWRCVHFKLIRIFSLDTCRAVLLEKSQFHVCKDILYDRPEFFQMETNSDSLFPKVERVNLLMDIYGDLLTEKQRRFVELHYSEDLSFGEIASQFNVSRQAIYDAVKHALSNLEHYEKTLSLLNKSGDSDSGNGIPKEAASAVSEVAPPDYASSISEVVQNLRQLKTRIQRQSIIYNVDPIIHEITKIIGQMDGIQGNGNSPGITEK